MLKAYFCGSPRSMCPGRKSSASTCSSGWRSSAPPMACAPASMSASTCWSTCLPAASRKRVIMFGLLCGALFTGIVGALRRHLRRPDVRTPASSRTISKRRCGSSISAIPLGSGLMCFRFLQVAWSFYWTGELAASRCRARSRASKSTPLHAARMPAPRAARAKARGKSARRLILILLPLS